MRVRNGYEECGWRRECWKWHHVEGKHQVNLFFGSCLVLICLRLYFFLGIPTRKHPPNSSSLRYTGWEISKDYVLSHLPGCSLQVASHPIMSRSSCIFCLVFEFCAYQGEMFKKPTTWQSDARRVMEGGSTHWQLCTTPQGTHTPSVRYLVSLHRELDDLKYSNLITTRRRASFCSLCEN